MNQINEFFRGLFAVGDWPPRWECGYWSDFHGWLYIFSDAAIWLAYFIIPVILIWFIQQKNDMPFLPIFWMFGGFIVFCGLTHLMDVIIFWWPAYRLSAVIRFCTAIISFATVFQLISIVPQALKLKPAIESPYFGNQSFQAYDSKKSITRNNDRKESESNEEYLSRIIDQRDQEIKRLRDRLAELGQD